VTAIQPCALLFLVGPDWRVETISANAGLLGQGQPESLVGRPLSQLIGSSAIHVLRNRMAWISGDESGIHDFGVRWGRADTAFDIHARRQGDFFLIEAEEAIEGRLADGIGMVQSLLDRVHSGDVSDIAEQGTRQLCALTGFNRLILRDRQGTVVAVGERGSLPAEGIAYSPSRGDLPHLIADRDADAVPLLGSLEGALLGQTMFPSPDDGLRQQLAEHGIQATMTLPLRIDGEWVGTIEAQHAVPRRCSAERRSVAALFAERLAARLARHGWMP